jgi:zinc transporter, ZIP family
MTTTTTPTPVPTPKPGLFNTLGLLLLPLALLAGVIALFLYTSGAGLNVEPAAPIESLSFERTVLRPGEIEFQVRNTSPQAVTIAMININDGIVRYTIEPDSTLPRLGQATIRVPYPWVEGDAYEIALFSSNSVAFTTAIEVATATKTVDNNTLLSFTLIGLCVGVIPVFLGLFWFPALRRLR